MFWDFDQRTLLICNNGGTSRDIIYQRNLAKRVPWIVVDIFFFSLVFRVFAFDAVDSLKDNIKILTFISFFENHFMHIVMLHLKVHSHLLERRGLGVKRLFDEDDFLDYVRFTFKMFVSSYLS